MANLIPFNIEGSKGSTAPTQRKPRETADTISMTGEAHVVDALCVGEIEGLVDPGPSGVGSADTRKQQSIFLDEVPFLQSDFPTVQHSVSTHFRAGVFGDDNQIPPFSTKLGSADYAGAAVPLPLPSSTRIRKARPLVVYFSSNTYPDATSAQVNVKIPALMETVADSSGGRIAGDVIPTFASYRIYFSLNGGAYSLVERVSTREKSSGGFVISSNVPLTKDPNVKTNYWKIKISRVSKDYDETTTKIQAQTHLESVIAKTEFRYTYPNTAVNALTFDAKTFPTLPQRAYRLRLKKIKVPVGYVPTQYFPYQETITTASEGDVGIGNRKIVMNRAQYPVIWDGSFSSTKVWTDNPAWIFYDMLTDKRYGLGEYIPGDKVDKWTLYQIAQYCDELVNAGGGDPSIAEPSESSSDWLLWAAFMEPRFACNLFLTENEEAFTVMNHLASTFRGITYWLGGAIFPVQDLPKSPVQQFTNANVIDGMFNYSSSERAQRRTVALVRWNDPEDMFRPKIEQVEDMEGIIRYGIRESETAAFGCTSRGQAHRVGTWTLLSERLETEFVSFDVGSNSLYTRPGHIISVYDDFRLRRKSGGRTLDVSASQDVVTLDRYVDFPEDPFFTYNLTLSIPQGYRDPTYTGSNPDIGVTGLNQTGDIAPTFLETQSISGFGFTGDTSYVTLDAPFSERYIGGTWTIQANNSGIISGASDYRILTMTETEQQSVRITALEYSAEKYGQVESGFVASTVSDVTYDNLPIGPPQSISLSGFLNIDDIDSSTVYVVASIEGSTGSNADYYQASGRGLPSGDWTELGTWEDPDNDGFFLSKYYPDNTGSVQICARSVQIGGAVSSEICGSTIVEVVNPENSAMSPRIEMTNADFNFPETLTSGTYNSQEPQFYVALQPSGGLEVTGDARYPYMEYIDLRYLDEGNNPVSRWFSTDWDEFITVGQTMGDPAIMGGDTLTGWPLRTLRIEAISHALPNLTATLTKTIVNPAPSSGALSMPKVTANSFEYIISPQEQIPDFSGVVFWSGETTVFPDIEDHFVRASLNGSIGYNGASGYLWWAIIDDFTTGGMIISGPQAMGLVELESHTGWDLDVNPYYPSDSSGNEQAVLNVSWSKHQSEDVIGYELDVYTDQADYYSDFFVSNANQQGNSVELSIPTPIYDRMYQSKVRALTFDNRHGAWSSEGSGYAVGPALTTLEVRGESTFRRPTRVLISGSTVENGTYDIDFGESNILNLDLINSTALEIGAQTGSVRDGATYLINVYASGAGAVSFNTTFKWPDGEQPSFTQGETGLIACTSLDTSNVLAVINNNFS